MNKSIMSILCWHLRLIIIFVNDISDKVIPAMNLKRHFIRLMIQKTSTVGLFVSESLASKVF